ncbi:zinc-ribbon domain-containing protein [Bizionia sediminis]|uniref:Zinc-ribbon domain-containing protein n=1 Tax=Bizionia sediminis TaxID=1737064 RepID=A0ABW5KTX8_9FLAO
MRQGNNKMFCNNCGHTIKDNPSFCSQCGYKIERTSMPIKING